MSNLNSDKYPFLTGILLIIGQTQILQIQRTTRGIRHSLHDLIINSPFHASYLIDVCGSGRPTWLFGIPTLQWSPGDARGEPTGIVVPSI